MVLLCGGARSGPGDGAPDSGIEAFLSRSESGRKGLHCSRLHHDLF